MDVRETLYFKQVDLLLQVLPVISEIEDFALKGGTAINLFVRDMPRLSVDIDLTYLPIDSRDTALQNISNHLTDISSEIQRVFPDTQITSKQKNGVSYGLTIRRGEAAIKVEPNTTLRGTVFPPAVRTLSPKAEELFERSVMMQNLSTEDLYTGKLCAALDRQHPRDLYDVYYLLQNEGITDNIRQTFIVYLLSHNRFISELLNPQLKNDLKETFVETFEGMTFEPTTVINLSGTAIGSMINPTLPFDSGVNWKQLTIVGQSPAASSSPFLTTPGADPLLQIW